MAIGILRACYPLTMPGAVATGPMFACAVFAKRHTHIRHLLKVATESG